MTTDVFWATIEQARSSGGDAHHIASRLHNLLAQRSADEIYAFLEQQASLMAQSYSWSLWGAAYVANGGCSDDGFDYFRGWLLAQGRAVFERALHDPDSLADLISEQEEADCQDMIGAAVLAYQDVTGDYPKGPRIHLPNLGPSWDFDDQAEMRRRYPRLVAKLHGE